MKNRTVHDLIVILGPTATGKTKLAVKIANEINGEIISADSRQVYKGIDIGTGKDLHEYIINNKKIHYHLIDIISPQKNYNVFQFQKDTKKIILELSQKGKIPILSGGTGLYIKAILMDFHLPAVKPDKQLRVTLEALSLHELIKKLNSIIDDDITEYLIDTKRRVIRAIEIEMNKKSTKSNQHHSMEFKFNNPLIIGIDFPRKIIREKITKRLHERLNEGMIEEVETLINNGLNHLQLESFGLEYRYISLYLQEKISKEEMIEKLNIAIHQFSKRQMTFFRNIEKNGIKINWVNEGNYESIIKLIKS